MKRLCVIIEESIVQLTRMSKIVHDLNLYVCKCINALKHITMGIQNAEDKTHDVWRQVN